MPATQMTTDELFDTLRDLSDSGRISVCDAATAFQLLRDTDPSDADVRELLAVG